MSKLGSSRYRSGHSKTWLKSKCFTESDLIIIGTDRDRKTGALRALVATLKATTSLMSVQLSLGYAATHGTQCMSDYSKSPSLAHP